MQVSEVDFQAVAAKRSAIGLATRIASAAAVEHLSNGQEASDVNLGTTEPKAQLIDGVKIVRRFNPVVTRLVRHGEEWQ